MERSRCLDCGLEIGGDNHIAVPGFQAVQIGWDFYGISKTVDNDLSRCCTVQTSVQTVFYLISNGLAVLD
jgi:6-phosphofructokinase